MITVWSQTLNKGYGAYKHIIAGAGHQVCSVSLSPYLLRGLPGWHTPLSTPNFSNQGWLPFPSCSPLYNLVIWGTLVLWLFCLSLGRWLLSGSPRPMSSHDPAQSDHVHVALCLPLAVLSLTCTINLPLNPCPPLVPCLQTVTIPRNTTPPQHGEFQWLWSVEPL